MGFFDRLAGMFSREKADDRKLRQVVTNAMRAYAGAKPSRTHDGWFAPGTGADTEIGQSLVALRDRARELNRDNPIARSGTQLWVSALAAGGYGVDFVSGSAFDKPMRDAWLRWAMTRQCDADGQLDLNGLVSLMANILVESGEVLIRVRKRAPSQYPLLAVPIQLQVLEPDYLDHNKNGINPDNGNPIAWGIEYDKANTSRRVAYWLFPEHPGNSRIRTTSFQSLRIRASEVIHAFKKERVQSRGVTWLHAVVRPLRDLGDYTDALLMKAKIEACYTVLIETDDEPEPTAFDANGNPLPREDRIDEVEPGMIRYLKSGETAKAFDPGNSSGHGVLLQSFLRMVAVGMGITYHDLWSDLTGANYSSTRTGTLKFNREVTRHQEEIFITQIIEPIVEAFALAGVRAGRFPEAALQGYRVEVTPPMLPVMDPKKDGDAERADLDYGLETLSNALRKRGHNPRRFLEDLKAERELLKQLDIHVPFGTATGQPQPGDTPDPEDGEDDETEETPKKEKEPA